MLYEVITVPGDGAALRAVPGEDDGRPRGARRCIDWSAGGIYHLFHLLHRDPESDRAGGSVITSYSIHYTKLYDYGM